MIVELSGQVEIGLILELESKLLETYSRFICIVVEASRATFDAQALSALYNMRKNLWAKQSRFFLVSTVHEKVDAKDLVEAMNSINTVESGRIASIYAKKQKLVDMEEKLKNTRQILFHHLQIQSDEGYENSLRQLKETNKQLEHLYSILTNEVVTLSKQKVKVDGGESKSVDPEVLKKIEAAKRLVSDALTEAGVLS
jgi:archaellum component FlaC